VAASIPAPWVFPLHLTSAHPVEDPRTGELFTANYVNPGAGNDGLTHLIRWHGAAHLEHFQLIDDNGDPVRIAQCVHQVAVTRNHVILQDSAFVVEMRQMAVDAAALLLPGMPVRELFGSQTCEAQRPTTVLYLIPRDQLRPRSGGPASDPTPVRCLRVEIPGESVHFFAQYDDDEKLEIIIPHTPTLDVSEWVHEGERCSTARAPATTSPACRSPAPSPRAPSPSTPSTRAPASCSRPPHCAATRPGASPSAPTPPSRNSRIETMLYFNTSGFAPELVPQRMLKTYRTASTRPSCRSRPAAPAPPQLRRRHRHRDQLPVPARVEHALPHLRPAPRQHRRPRDGYLVCLAHCADSVPRPHDTSGEELWIFDAADITAGPLCRLGHPELDFAFTIHSTWVPELRPSPRDYRVSILKDDLDLDQRHPAAPSASSRSGTCSPPPSPPPCNTARSRS
jgi:hypothetical protein